LRILNLQKQLLGFFRRKNRLGRIASCRVLNRRGSARRGWIAWAAAKGRLLNSCASGSLDHRLLVDFRDNAWEKHRGCIASDHPAIAGFKRGYEHNFFASTRGGIPGNPNAIGSPKLALGKMGRKLLCGESEFLVR